MGARLEARDGRFAAVRRARQRALRAIDYELPVASAQVKSCVLLRRRSAPTARRRVVEPAPQPRPHRADAAARRRPSVRRDGAHASRVACTPTSCSSTSVRRARRPARSAAFLIAAGVLVPGSRLLDRATSASTGRAPASCGSSSAWARSCSATLEDAPRTAVAPASPSPTSTSRTAPLDGHGRRGRRGAAGDRRAAAGRAARVLRRGRDVVRGAQELRVKESDRIAGVVDGLRGLGGDDRGDRRRLRRAGQRAACAAARSTRAATTAWRCSARSPAWPRARASRSSGWRRRRCPTRGFADDLAALLAR